jgi:transposase
MVLAFIDIHKHVFQACAVEPETGTLYDERFAASVEGVDAWLAGLPEPPRVVAIESTSGWRWVWRLLAERGIEVQLVDPGQARALQGRQRKPKTDKLDARWGVLLLEKEMLPQAWIPPIEIQQLRDQTRLRRALVVDRTRWAQRLHALLQHEGFPVRRSRLLTAEGRRWAASVSFAPHLRSIVDTMLSVISALDAQIDQLETTLRRFARSDARCRALTTLRGIGPIFACVLVAEIGDAKRFRRARQLVRAAGIDPVVADSADTRRRGRLSKAGSPHLRHALVEAATWAARPGSPDHPRYLATKQRIGSQKARISCARSLAGRIHRTLLELDTQAA